MPNPLCCALVVAASTSAPALPDFDAPVSADRMLGVGLERAHYDDDGFPQSEAGMLVVEVDEQVGPITIMAGDKPHYIEAQFTNRQRDGVFLSREGDREDPLPNGEHFTIPYGYGALKMSLSAVTLVEAQLKPHFSDNQKSFEVFPISDLYLGGALSLTGPKVDARYVYTESLSVYGQVGFNVLAVAGARVANTYGAYALGFTAGGGYRYPAPVTLLGTHWTSGAEVRLGAVDADDDPTTYPVVLMAGLVQELEWTLDREIEVEDHRDDPRPSNWGLHSIFGKVGFYLDLVSGAGGSGIFLFDVSVGYRFNLMGPEIPRHDFKATTVTFASERYVERKREEAERQRALEEMMQRRKAKDQGATDG